MHLKGHSNKSKMFYSNSSNQSVCKLQKKFNSSHFFLGLLTIHYLI